MEEIIVVNDKVTDMALLYEKREIEGKRMYYRVTSETIVGGFPRSQRRQMAKALRKVRNELVNGQVIDALEELELVTDRAVVNQEFYDKIHAMLTNYIANDRLYTPNPPPPPPAL